MKHVADLKLRLVRLCNACQELKYEVLPHNGGDFISAIDECWDEYRDRIMDITYEINDLLVESVKDRQS